MSARRLAALVLALGALSALAFAPNAGAAKTRETTATQIDTAKNPELGTFLVAGDTVYTLKPSKVQCTAKCLKAWPPVLLPSGVTAATAGAGVDASKLGTVSTPAGDQITYGGKALYWYVKDKAPGQVKGNIKDKWGKWATVVTVKGKGGSGGSKKTNSGTGGTAF
jgi:predicted lipoprotein with Yx(FWY)xxD motif